MTKKNFLLAFVFLFIFVQVIFIFSGGLFAQQIQTIPITPQYQPATIPTQPMQQQQPTLLQLTPQPAVQPAPPQQLQPSAERPSVFEQFISGGISFGVSTDIKQFGYDIFRQPPSTFAPVERVPVGPDYVLGPGDEIRINVWGRIEGQ